MPNASILSTKTIFSFFYTYSIELVLQIMIFKDTIKYFSIDEINTKIIIAFSITHFVPGKQFVNLTTYEKLK